MIETCVIDASVAIKWVIAEEGTDAANRLRWGGTTFHAPDLIVPETGKILWKKRQRDELTQDEAELACGLLRLAKIDIHAMWPHASVALRIAIELKHPVYDTTYLALALELGIPMITADRRLVKRLAESGRSDIPNVLLLS